MSGGRKSPKRRTSSGSKLRKTGSGIMTFFGLKKKDDDGESNSNRERNEKKNVKKKKGKTTRRRQSAQTENEKEKEKDKEKDKEEEDVTKSEEDPKEPPHTNCNRIIVPKEVRTPPPERTTAATEHIGEIKKLYEEGQAVMDFEQIKTAAKEFALNAAKLMPKGAVDEYQAELRKYAVPGFSTKAFTKNISKNRYRDVPCCDNERVVLQDTCCGDYIHANHIRGPPLNSNQHFICTQGPTAYTVSDFWRMVKQENVQQIIMLCETVEAKKTKCLQYWPLFDEEVMKLTDAAITVTNKGRYIHEPGTITTVLQVKDTKKDQSYHMFHHQWKLWPDRGVPDTADVLLRLLQLARACPSDMSVVIHCSAGIGRTGTIMAAEMGIQCFLQNKTPNVLEIVKTLREKRAQAVQTYLQYAFVFKILLCWLEKTNPDAETSKAIQDFLGTFQTIVCYIKHGVDERTVLLDPTINSVMDPMK
ncbi:unnamed protein product [Bursaphelenchus okinawaensis]|uniref:Tyrosine phosphatase n=1 Tax=Bursaphelenchus okinawaensis TaxID=465554 RepID=A0A811L659_9BILA|nr:unnamed protein product [Bursaphelenchus okinawaensis]CAG9117319.1 unnamed protein product [Bursaphelenchus okinawaensis]